MSHDNLNERIKLYLESDNMDFPYIYFLIYKNSNKNIDLNQNQELYFFNNSTNKVFEKKVSDFFIQTPPSKAGKYTITTEKELILFANLFSKFFVCDYVKAKNFTQSTKVSKIIKNSQQFIKSARSFAAICDFCVSRETGMTIDLQILLDLILSKEIWSESLYVKFIENNYIRLIDRSHSIRCLNRLFDFAKQGVNDSLDINLILRKTIKIQDDGVSATDPFEENIMMAIIKIISHNLRINNKRECIENIIFFYPRLNYENLQKYGCFPETLEFQFVSEMWLCNQTKTSNHKSSDVVGLINLKQESFLDVLETNEYSLFNRLYNSNLDFLRFLTPSEKITSFILKALNNTHINPLSNPIILYPVKLSEKEMNVILKNDNLFINDELININYDFGIITRFRLYIKLGFQNVDIKWYNYIKIYLYALYRLFSFDIKYLYALYQLFSFGIKYIKIGNNFSEKPANIIISEQTIEKNFLNEDDIKYIVNNNITSLKKQIIVNKNLKKQINAQHLYEYFKFLYIEYKKIRDDEKTKFINICLNVMFRYSAEFENEDIEIQNYRFLEINIDIMLFMLNVFSYYQKESTISDQNINNLFIEFLINIVEDFAKITNQNTLTRKLL